MRLRSLCADTSDSYNDVGREAATIRDTGWMPADAQPLVTLPPHSVHILTLE
jgi:hypothetical protein